MTRLVALLGALAVVTGGACGDARRGAATERDGSDVSDVSVDVGADDSATTDSDDRDEGDRETDGGDDTTGVTTPDVLVRDSAGDPADTSALCGNGALDDGEPCDGALFRASTSCLDLGFEGGAFTCDAGCGGVSLAGCVTDAVCGDGLIGGPEVCDGDDVARDESGQALTCEAFGYSAPATLGCASDCLRWDVSGCPEDIAGWRCPVLYYDDGDCDCGCGVRDPDCGDAGADACVYCNDSGSCSRDRAWGCGDIDPADPGACLPVPPR